MKSNYQVYLFLFILFTMYAQTQAIEPCQSIKNKQAKNIDVNLYIEDAKKIMYQCCKEAISKKSFQDLKRIFITFDENVLNTFHVQNILNQRLE